MHLTCDYVHVGVSACVLAFLLTSHMLYSFIYKLIYLPLFFLSPPSLSLSLPASCVSNRLLIGDYDNNKRLG